MLLILLQNNCDGFWAWPWPLIAAFLLGLLLGWLLSKLFGGSDNATCESCDGLRAELKACRDSAKVTASSFAASNTKAKPKAKKVAIAKVDKSVKDDLTKVEGIGPKIAGLLNDDGIWSWKQLSDTTANRIQKVLDAAGPRYRVHDPETWPMQAGMADNGEWKKLEKWQDEHKGGKA
jgi:predicted flap endonuclease-1-like 5' DNA nuclease